MPCGSPLSCPVWTLHHSPMVEFVGGRSCYLSCARPGQVGYPVTRHLPANTTLVLAPLVCTGDPCLGRVHNLFASPLHRCILYVFALPFAPDLYAFGDSTWSMCFRRNSSEGRHHTKSQWRGQNPGKYFVEFEFFEYSHKPVFRQLKLTTIFSNTATVPKKIKSNKVNVPRRNIRSDIGGSADEKQLCEYFKTRNKEKVLWYFLFQLFSVNVLTASSDCNTCRQKKMLIQWLTCWIWL